MRPSAILFACGALSTAHALPAIGAPPSTVALERSFSQAIPGFGAASEAIYAFVARQRGGA